MWVRSSVGEDRQVELVEARRVGDQIYAGGAHKARLTTIFHDLAEGGQAKMPITQ